VRIVARFAELRRDQCLEILGDVVLQDLRLGVDAVARHPQRLGEERLDQPVMADHLERDLLPGGRQAHSLVRDVFGEADLGELLQHRRRGRRGDAEARGDLAGRHEPLTVGPERVHRLRVVLYRLRIRHV